MHKKNILAWTEISLLVPQRQFFLFFYFPVIFLLRRAVQKNKGSGDYGILPTYGI